nr:MAG TPA: hypothetical protein [Caudoviricetes sp.]
MAHFFFTKWARLFVAISRKSRCLAHLAHFFYINIKFFLILYIIK